jgi:hypothetical protein
VTAAAEAAATAVTLVTAAEIAAAVSTAVEVVAAEQIKAMPAAEQKEWTTSAAAEPVTVAEAASVQTTL